jgi:hypothetical protein
LLRGIFPESDPCVLLLQVFEGTFTSRGLT